jgi:hypothetical protein
MDQAVGMTDDIKSRVNAGTWKICFRTSCVRLKRKKNCMTCCFEKIYILIRARVTHAINRRKRG